MPSTHRHSPRVIGDHLAPARSWLSSGVIPLALLACCGLCWISACGEEDARRGAPGAAPPPQKAVAQAQAAQAEGGEDTKVGESASELADREVPEAVFVETDENRDPFRSYISVFTLVQTLPEEEFAPRLDVLLEDVSLDEMRLIAIISGEGGNPRAMVVDPDGKGWVVRRGDYVGRGEKVRVGPGQPERDINWRVVRIRPDRIILVREDPAEVGPPVTRVMRLYPEEEG